MTSKKVKPQLKQKITDMIAPKTQRTKAVNILGDFLPVGVS